MSYTENFQGLYLYHGRYRPVIPAERFKKSLVKDAHWVTKEWIEEEYGQIELVILHGDRPVIYTRYCIVTVVDGGTHEYFVDVPHPRILGSPDPEPKGSGGGAKT